MKKVRIGVLGAYRGASMINYCKHADNAEIVAICDKSHEALDAQRDRAKGFDITFYDNFADFIKHDMDAVVLANYANEHAPFAIAAMKEGKHVFSEVLPVQTAAGLTKTMAPRNENTITTSEIERPESDVHNFYRNFCKAIKGEAEMIVTHAQLMRVMRIMEACFESDTKKAPVKFEDEIC